MSNTWVSIPNGISVTYGEIPEVKDIICPEWGCALGEIRLPVGDITKGQIHLSTQKRRKRLSPKSPEEYVYLVTSSYDEIYLQEGRGSLLLVKRDVMKTVVVALDMSELGVYNVITAFTINKDHNFRKRKERCIWKREENGGPQGRAGAEPAPIGLHNQSASLEGPNAPDEDGVGSQP